MINQFKSPRDKIIILINFVYILNTMIDENSKKKNPSGADEVFPIVVYAILKSNICKLKINMKYIKALRHHSRLESAEEYYFTTISSAIEFIEKLKYEHLSHIEDNEFSMLCCKQEKFIEESSIKQNLKSIKIFFNI